MYSTAKTQFNGCLTKQYSIVVYYDPDGNYEIYIIL